MDPLHQVLKGFADILIQEVSKGNKIENGRADGGAGKAACQLPARKTGGQRSEGALGSWKGNK